jgi:hypothetical protein
MISKIIALKKLQTFFKKNRMAHMDELFTLLETTSRMTVFRRLKELNYLSSFTHAGRYYTLESIIHFDANGLWFCEGVGFSQFGNLKETIRHIVDQSMAGKKHIELENQLQVRVHNPLLELVRLNKITRQSFDKTFLYLNHQQDKAGQQLACRQQNQTGCLDDVLPDSLVIEVLSEIIRSDQLEIDCQKIAAQVLKNGFNITSTQCDDLCQRLGLKKTLDS